MKANEHWRPQTDFLVYKNYDDYFCFEDFPAAENILHEKIGLEIYDARELTKHGSERWRTIDDGTTYSDVPIADLFTLKRSGIIPSALQLYDDSIKAKVNQLFLEDIEFYVSKTGRSCIF